MVFVGLVYLLFMGFSWASLLNVGLAILKSDLQRHEFPSLMLTHLSETSEQLIRNLRKIRKLVATPEVEFCLWHIPLSEAVVCPGACCGLLCGSGLFALLAPSYYWSCKIICLVPFGWSSLNSSIRTTFFFCCLCFTFVLNWTWFRYLPW
jgi:hypothetical protein